MPVRLFAEMRFLAPAVAPPMVLLAAPPLMEMPLPALPTFVPRPALPAAWIEAADENGVRVAATSEQVDGLEPVTLAQYTDPPEDWIPPDNAAGSQFLFPASPYAVGAFTMPATQIPSTTEEVLDLPGNQVAINDGTVVYCTDGEVGAVNCVITQEGSGRMDLLIVDIGGLEKRLAAVPMDRITAIGDGHVNLALSVRELDAYPEWEPPVTVRAAA